MYLFIIYAIVYTTYLHSFPIMLNENRAKSVIDFHQLVDGLESFARDHFFTSADEPIDSAKIFNKIKDRMIYRLHKIGALAQNEAQSKKSKLVIWDMLYAGNIYEILYYIARGIRKFEESEPNFYGETEHYYYQFCLVVISQIYPDKQIQEGSQVRLYCPSFVILTLQYFNLMRGLGWAITQAYSEYSHYNNSTYSFYHHKHGVCVATGRKLTLSQHFINANLIAILVELERILSYTPSWRSQNTRFRPRSFNTYLLKYIADHRINRTAINQFHDQGENFIHNQKVATLSQVQRILRDARIDRANIDKYEIGFQGAQFTPPNEGVRTANGMAEDHSAGSMAESRSMASVIDGQPVSAAEDGDYIALATTYNKCILFQFEKIVDKFSQLCNQNLSEAIRSLDKYIHEYHAAHFNEQTEIPEGLKNLGQMQHGNFRGLLLNIGAIMYASVGGGEGVTHYNPFFTSFIQFLYNKSSDNSHEKNCDYIMFSIICQEYAFIKNYFISLIEAAKNDYIEWFRNKGWFFSYMNLTHHESDINEANVFFALVNGSRDDILNQRRLLREKLQTAPLSHHSFSAYLIKYLYFSPSIRTDFHEQTIEEISEQKNRLLTWLSN